MKPVFESYRICFVHVAESLIQDYLIMINDLENVEKYLGGPHGPYTEEQEIEWVRKNLEDHNPVFSMLEKSGRGFIGNIELMNLTHFSGELGIAITAEMQDQGYGTEAVLAMTKYGFHQLGLKRIYLRANPDNGRAIHVYEKCGFKEYDRDPIHVYMESLR